MQKSRMQVLEEKGKWMHDICGQRKRRKAKSLLDDESSDSDADDVKLMLFFAVIS